MNDVDLGTVDLGLFLGDFNHSASVNQFDLALFIPKLFVPPGNPNYNPKFDLNGDALLNVNQFDLALLIDRLFKPVLPAPLVVSASLMVSASLVTETDSVDLLQASVDASQPSLTASSLTVSSLTPATTPTLISQPGESLISRTVSFSLQAFEVSDGIFYTPLSLSDDAYTTGLELESNTDQVDLDYRTRRFLGDRAVTKPTDIDLTDEDNFAEIDDMFHSIDWLNDGSFNGLTDDRFLERALIENRLVRGIASRVLRR